MAKTIIYHLILTAVVIPCFIQLMELVISKHLEGEVYMQKIHWMAFGLVHILMLAQIAPMLMDYPLHMVILVNTYGRFWL